MEQKTILRLDSSELDEAVKEYLFVRGFKAKYIDYNLNLENLYIEDVNIEVEVLENEPTAK